MRARRRRRDGRGAGARAAQDSGARRAGSGAGRDADEASLGAGRDDGRGRGGPELEAAAHVVGRSEPRRRLEQRRHAQRAAEPAEAIRHARRSSTPTEFLERAERDQAGRDRAVNTETFLRNEWGVRTFGYTSLVVDPRRRPDARDDEPGMARAASRDRGTFGPGPFNDFGDFTLYERCITRGILGSALPVIYGNGLRIEQSPG